MSEELKTEELVPVPIEEQVSQELVKHNYTEAKLSELEEYLKLDIIDDDKESYLVVKDKRKEVKSYRVAVEKFCKFKREDAVKIQKAWVSNENKLVARLSKVEDHLESKEKAYEKKIAEEKEARKRKQEEQLVVRQQVLSGYGALYSDGVFTLGEVSFELSVVKESEEDVWHEAIWPKFEEEYKKIQAEQIENDRLKAEKEAEFKRQQEELEQKKKELAEEAERLQQEAARQALEADKRRAVMIENRTIQITSLGFTNKGAVGYSFHEFTIIHEDIHDYTNEEWHTLISGATEYVDAIKKEEAEAQKKEQERKELQNKRYAEMYPYAQYSYPVAMDSLWQFPEDKYMGILEGKKAAFQEAEKEKNRQIAEAAAKKERERIEEEQKQADVKMRQELRGRRKDALLEYNYVFTALEGDLADLTDTQWLNLVTEAKASYDENIRKQEEERKAEEMAQASDKKKWGDIMHYLEGMQVHEFRSGQYRRRAAILREKIEEIKAL